MIPSASELILILLIVVVVFGAKRIPEIMGGLGKGIRTFKKAMDGEEEAQNATPPPGPDATAPPQQVTSAPSGAPAAQSEAKDPTSSVKNDPK
jgi:sec-independent protein translocase protein TatA